MNVQPSLWVEEPPIRPPVWQPWLAIALFAFLSHFAWEIFQTPFYASMAEASHWAAVLRCTRATAGDVVIAELAYVSGALVARDRLWLGLARRTVPFAACLGLGLAVTIALEWWNVYVRGSWAYSTAMPVFLGIGVSPLLQWILLPPVTLWLARRHLGRELGA